MLAEKGLGQSGAGGTHLPLPAQNGAFGVEGTDLWLAASGDQRVSIWASNWLRDCCELVDWLSFPAPILREVRVLVAPQGGHGACPSCHSTLCLSSGFRLLSTLPRRLLSLG